MPIALRVPSLLFVLLLTLLLGACKKEEAEPQTGNLVIRFDYGASLSEASYALYTEQTWTGTRSASPLRTGQLARLPQNTTSFQAQIRFNDLNAGNYVLVVGNSNTWSVQVTAGKTNEVDKR